MRGMIKDTLYELLDRKLLWLYGSILLIAIVAIIVLTQVNTSMQTETGRLGMQEGIEQIGRAVAIKGTGSYVAVLLFVTVMATAGLLPSMLSRGRAEYYLSQPVSRSTAYTNKLLSMLLIYGAVLAICVAVCVILLQVVLSFVSSGILWLVVYAIISLFVWLAVTTFVGMVARTVTWPAAVAVLLFFVQLGLSEREVFYPVLESEVGRGLLDAAYYILPKFSDMGAVFDELAIGNTPETWLPVWSTLLFGIVVTAIAAGIIRRKDF